MLSLRINPFAWAKNGRDVESDVVSFELGDPNKRTIPVAGLSQDIVLTIPTTPTNKTPTPQEPKFVKPEVMRYHHIRIAYPGTAVTLVPKASNGTVLKVYAKENQRPSVDDYDYRFTVPNVSKCPHQSLEGCSRDDAYRVTIVSKERGFLSVGIYYLSREEHVRQRRSCFGHRRQKRSCIGFKDPPPKGVNKTLVPTYDPTTDVNYTLEVDQRSCLYWSDEEQTWTSAGCKVSKTAHFQSSIHPSVHLYSQPTNQRTKLTFRSFVCPSVPLLFLYGHAPLDRVWFSEIPVTGFTSRAFVSLTGYYSLDLWTSPLE